MPNNELYKITATLQQKHAPQSAEPQKTAAERLFAIPSSTPDISQKTTTASGLAIVRPIEYTVPKEAIYDRLNDGTYIAKFENYIGATGNEDRLAKEQTTGEKWGHGLTKMAAKIGTYAVDSVIGTAYGIGAAIGTGQFHKLYDNDFASWMDDTNKKLDNKLVTYYSDEEKSMNVLESMGTANFWANDVTGGLAFVGGAILPQIAIGALTGGATLGAGAAKLSMQIGSKVGNKIVREGIEEVAEQTTKQTVKSYVRAKLASNALGTPLDKAAFFARTASFEAGMEARQSYKTNVQDFYTKFEEQNGRLPTTEEAKPFLDDARNASNGVYNTNLAILSVSNAVMFGKKIIPTSITNKLGAVTNRANKLIGLGVKEEMVEGVLTKSMIKATKGQKLLGNVYKLSRKPLTEGLYEEGFQGVTTKTAENYLNAKYNPQNTETLSLMANLADGFKEQYSTNEGWKEMAIGLIIGFGGGGMSPGAFKKGSGAFSGIGSDSRLATQKRMEAGLTVANEGVTNFRNLNRTEGAKAFAAMGTDGKVAKNYEDTVGGYNFIKSQEHLSTPGQILEDHHKTIDAMTFEEDPKMKDFLAENNFSETSYKQSLKDSFENTLKDYRFAKSSVEALGLDRTLKDTPGNINEIKESFTMNIMLGKNSLSEAKRHSEQFDSLLGTSGTFDAVQFYQGLSEENRKNIDLLKEKQNSLKELQAEATSLGERMAGSRPKAGFTSEQLSAYKNDVAERAFQTQQTILKTAEEIKTLEGILNDEFETSQLELSQSGSLSRPSDINSVLDQLGKVDKHIDNLSKAGKIEIAGSLQYLVGQIKYHSDAHREMVNTHRKMLNTNFFSAKEGKGLLSRILGKKYLMSEDLQNSIDDNDNYVDESLRLMGQRGDTSESVKETIRKALEENPNLSEREKHRLEDLVRLQLTGSTAAKIVEELTSASEQIAATQTKSTVGDTIELAKTLNLKEKDLSNLAILTQAIDDITKELDSIINANSTTAAEKEQLKQQLLTLKEQRDAIEESIKQEEISNEQSRSSERKGISSGQQEVGESEGIERETTTNETDNSNSLITSETQEEVELYPSEEELSAIDSSIEAYKSFSLEGELEYEKKRLSDLINETETSPPKESFFGKIYDWAIGKKFSYRKKLLDLTNDPLRYYQQELKRIEQYREEDEAEYKWDSLIIDLNVTILKLKYQGQTTTAYTYIQRDPTLQQEVEDNTTDLDQLIEQRIANYGLEPFDLFEGIAEADVNIIERAKVGQKVDINALQGTTDFLYNIYKKLLELKKPENSQERLSKSITLQYLAQIQTLLEEDLEFLETYKNAYETGETLPTFEYPAESTVVTPAEGGTTETTARVTTETAIQPTELEKIDLEIARVEARIEALNKEGYQIIESQEYKRFTALSAKQEKKELTPAETAELEELKESLDKWTLITGAVIDGFRLSDLLEQKVVVESTPIESLVDIVVQETEETLNDVDIPDRAKSVNRKYGNTFDKVLFSVEGKGANRIITLYHITKAALEDVVGVLPIRTDRVDERGNILLTAEEVDLINTQTPMRIKTDYKVSRTSPVAIEKLQSDGTYKFVAMDSTYNTEFNNGQGHNVKSIYDAKPGDKVSVIIDPRSDWNKTLLAPLKNLKNELKRAKSNPAEKARIQLEIKNLTKLLESELQILAVVNGEVVATFKGIRGGVKNATDEIFEDLRRAIISDPSTMDQLLSDTARGRIEVKIKGKDGVSRFPIMTVEQVLLGIPNYNYEGQPDGGLSQIFKPLTEEEQKVVKDIGYLYNGKTYTRDGVGVDTTFLRTMQKRSKTSKIPFIVLEVGGKRVAYPVRVQEEISPDTTEFETIYNSEISSSDKAKALNRFMASRGIDIKTKGNAFISFGVTNITDQFFQEKLAALKEISYFYEVENWVNQDVPMDEVLRAQISVDINVLDPFHSPKLAFDYKDLDIEKSKVKKPSTAIATSEEIDDEAEESSLLQKPCK
jgi:hypothetical protein